jgi:deazaflavin-dependent oxidoreductase (nitroreductase family)
MGAYRSFAGWVGDKPWFRPVSSRLVPMVDTALLRSRGWRVTPFPTLLLTTAGHQTGRPHHSPLYYLEDDGFVVIASNYGRAEPQWSRNLAGNPVCSVRVGRRGIAARANRVAEEHWTRYLEQFAAFYPPYRDYVARAGRQVPIWKLAPASAGN